MLINQQNFKEYIKRIDNNLDIAGSTNKSLFDWMTPIIESLTDDGAVPYLLNTTERYRASPLASTIIWLEKAGLLPIDILDVMQNKLMFLRDACQENDPHGHYDKQLEDAAGWSLAEGVSIWSTSLAIIALMDTDDNGIKKISKYKDSILWLAQQQDVNKKGWAYQLHENCDVNAITTGLALQALAKAYSKIPLLCFSPEEKKLILQAITSGFIYLKETCNKKRDIHIGVLRDTQAAQLLHGYCWL
jgi:hypothetical protein